MSETAVLLDGRLTDDIIAAEKLAATDQKRMRKVSDGDGLLLLINADGSAWWRFRYWIDGRENMVSLGRLDSYPLQEARKIRNQKQELLAVGLDPSVINKDIRAKNRRKRRDMKPELREFGQLIFAWMKDVHRKKVSARVSAQTLALLERSVLPFLADKWFFQVQPSDFLNLLEQTRSNESLDAAYRLKSILSQVFRYGIVIGKVERDLIADLQDALPAKGSPEKQPVPEMQPSRLAAVLKSFDTYAGRQATRTALALAPLLLLRPGDLRTLEWSWFDRDPEIASLPDGLKPWERRGRIGEFGRLVPVAPSARKLVDELRQVTGKGKFLFPSSSNDDQPMSVNTLNTAFRSMGFARTDASISGIRAMAAKFAREELGLDRHVIRAQLNGSPTDRLDRPFNEEPFLAQRQQMMLKWADRVAELRAA